MATSPATLLRNALAAALGTDATIRSLCGRSAGCVVEWRALADAQRPVLALLVSFAEELDGIDDVWQLTALISALAVDARGTEIAEALAQRAREVVATIAVVAPGLEASPERVTLRPVDDEELNPPGQARYDLEISYRAEVL